MPFLLAEILNFQGSTHRIGVGSFSKLIYSMAGINGDAAPIEDIEKAKKKIKELKNERDILLKENKILKKNLALEFLSSTNDRAALEGMLKEVHAI